MDGSGVIIALASMATAIVRIITVARIAHVYTDTGIVLIVTGTGNGVAAGGDRIAR